MSLDIEQYIFFAKKFLYVHNKPAVNIFLFSVLDRNDNAPEFSEQSYTFRGKWHFICSYCLAQYNTKKCTVPETEPAGQTVFTGVSLTDKDTGPNSQVGE